MRPGLSSRRVGRSRRWAPILGFALFPLSASTPALSQGVTTGTIAGRVADAEARPLSGALVTVTDGRTRRVAKSTTNEAGRYLVPHLPPGRAFEVEVRLLGFGPVVRSGVAVDLGRTTALDFELRPAAIDVPPLEVVIEPGATSLIGPTRTGTETFVDDRELEALPSVTRQITDYAFLSPQVVAVRDGASAGGRNFRYNSIRIDGALNHDLFGLTDSGIPGAEGNARVISVEALEEVQVLTAPFDVRHSGFTGALLNAVTKSGTNRWSGSAFGYHINDAWTSAPDGGSPAEFDDTRFGWTLGGPLARDRAFLFTNGEFELETTPSAGPSFTPGGQIDSGARLALVHPDSALRLIRILEGYGFRDIGTTEAVTLENPRTNLFGRLDIVTGDRSRLVLRHSYSRTRVDQGPLRRPGDFRLSSAGRRFTASTNSTVLQYFSALGGRWSNEAMANLQFVRNDRDALVSFPFITATVGSRIDGRDVTGDLSAGAEPVAQGGNALEQEIFQLADRATGALGRHELAIGTHNELFRFRDRFFVQSLGTFRFASLADLERNSPALYTVNTLAPGIEDASVSWSLLSVGGYAQDTWSATDRLTVTAGVRVEVHTFLDEPVPSPDFEAVFGFGTDRSPAPHTRFQPRLGFNWIDGDEQRTQLRGGVGLFAGRPSFVWLSNAFRDTGNRFLVLQCPASTAPRLDPSSFPASPPQRCTDGTGPSPALTPIAIADPDYVFPLDLKVSFGIDRKIRGGLVVTGEVLYSRAVDQPFMEEYNLVEEPVSRDGGQGGRPLFGTPTRSGFAPVRRADGFANVVRLTNRSGDRALLATLGLNRHLNDWLDVRVSYTWSDVDDRQALISPLSQFGVASNPVRGNPNQPELATSPFERRHRILVFATGRWALGGGVGLSLTSSYEAASGAPYSYTVAGDVNGDGYPGPFVGRGNDLVYVPRGAGELAFVNPADAQALEAFIASEPCLDRQRGSLMRRNSCFAPWRGRLDVRGTIGMTRAWGGVELVLDVLNLLGQAFEQPSSVPFATSILRLAGRVDDDPAQPLLFSYIGPADGEALLEALRPESQRRFQLGLRVRF